MLIVVTTVSLLVHIYSIGYMSHDHHKQRFFSYLSLFTFFMLVLVTGTNMLQTFVGWEGVGLCSYLLIGFWFHKKSANDAAIKAFIANRVGDLAFIIGMCGVYHLFGSLDYSVIFLNVDKVLDQKIIFCSFECSYITFICIALFIGCMGKSAQIGLHIWLPDAMEGPTPVSALIHAATMVTAGVFLVAKCSHLYEYSGVARNLIMIIGAITAVFGASIAVVQTDIKKIIAYSTCSQLGYMFFACGASMYTAGIFHLATHAFFKALLFLSAGSVIHAMSDEQNIFKMGGLMKKIPFTFACFIIGSVAIAGLPPLSGFYSKDAILESAFAHGGFIGQFSYYAGIVAAFMTSFYSWRLISLVFHGKSRASNYDFEHAHESPSIMLLPLCILAIGSTFAGYLGSTFLHILDPNSTFWSGAILVLEHNNIYESMHHVPTYAKIMPLALSAFAIGLAYLLYLKYDFILTVISKTFKKAKTILEQKYYFDQLYNVIFIRPTLRISTFCVQVFDKRVIDLYIPTLCVKIACVISKLSSKIHSGKITLYIFTIFAFIILIFYYILLSSIHDINGFSFNHFALWIKKLF